jgi:hypothetical protein
MGYKARQQAALIGALVSSALLIALAHRARGAVIPNFQIGLNNTGFDRGGVVAVPIVSTDNGAPGSSQWKDDFYHDFIEVMRPKAGRHMDYWQAVTNNTTTWANRSLNDFSDKGLTYESTINIDKQALRANPNYAPWLDSPIFADENHDEELGYLYGRNYPGKVIYFGKGDEGWHIYGDNLPAQQMRAAIAAGEFGSSEFEQAGRGWGKRLGRGTVAFERGLLRAGRTDVTVIMAVEGFAPTTAWVEAQAQGMRSIGIDPAAHHAHVSIAQYAFGGRGDARLPTGTDDQKAAAILDFIQSDSGMKGWTLAHRAWAVANGLAPLVDAYEMKLGTMDTLSEAEFQDWKRFHLSPQMFRVQSEGLDTLVAASGGPGATLNVEGFWGFPFLPSGQFPLLDLDQRANPDLNMAWAGVKSKIDFNSVPEPSAWQIGLIGFIIGVCTSGRGRGRLAKRKKRN